LGFLGPDAGGPQTQSVFWPPPLRTPNPRTKQRSEENAPISQRPNRKSGRPAVIWWDEEEESERDVRLRVERMIAQGKAHPDDRFFYVSWRR
jgi:hypothetical protein